MTKEILLCDCPGLVFPSIVSSKAEMICNGVISLNNLVNYIDPIKYILYKSSYEMLLRKYKLPLELEEFTPKSSEGDYEKVARDLLQYYSATRGYITGGSGIPDEFKAARIMLE